MSALRPSGFRARNARPPTDKPSAEGFPAFPMAPRNATQPQVPASQMAPPQVGNRAAYCSTRPNTCPKEYSVLRSTGAPRSVMRPMSRLTVAGVAHASVQPRSTVPIDSPLCRAAKASHSTAQFGRRLPECPARLTVQPGAPALVPQITLAGRVGVLFQSHIFNCSGAENKSSVHSHHRFERRAFS